MTAGACCFSLLVSGFHAAVAAAVAAVAAVVDVVDISVDISVDTDAIISRSV